VPIKEARRQGRARCILQCILVGIELVSSEALFGLERGRPVAR
jgi:hypothetical protein